MYISESTIAKSPFRDPGVLDSRQPLTISYANIDGVDIQLDVYIPLGVHAPRPAVLFFHGGGCFSGTRRNEGIGYFPWVERSYQYQALPFQSADLSLCRQVKRSNVDISS